MSLSLARAHPQMLAHADVTFWWVTVGVLTFPVLLFVSAPYGKLVRDGWGGRIDGRLGWFVQEIPSPIVLTLSFAYGGDLLAFDDATRTPGVLSYTCIAVWWAHYLNRAVYYPLVRRMSDTTVPVVLTAIAFNFVNGTLVGTELTNGSAHLTNPSTPVVAIGAVLCITGACVNIAADAALRNLRVGRPVKDAGKHFVPNGGLFNLVTCPHYLGECVEWLGFAIATRTTSGYAFAFWTFVNLMPRAVAYRTWYRNKFGKRYPASRKAMLPFVW